MNSEAENLLASTPEPSAEADSSRAPLTGSGNPPWWPNYCPWPEDVWAMTVEDYVRAVPDEKTRTAISGLLMRMGWNCALKTIKASLEEMGADSPNDGTLRPPQEGLSNSPTASPGGSQQ